jgi:hypothetical protein
MSFLPPNTNITVTLDTLDTSYVKTTGATFTGPLVLNGSNLILSNGTELIAGRNLTSDGAVIDAINTGEGLVYRSGAGTFTQKPIAGAVNQLLISDSSGTITFSLADNPTVPGTSHLTLPIGTDEQRPSGANGRIRYNSTQSTVETAIGSIWKSVVLSDDKRLNHHNVWRVAKDPAESEYPTIEAAILACSSTAAAGEQCLIEVGPGEYVENPLTVPENVHISGFSEYAITVKPASAAAPLFTCEVGCTVSFLTVRDVIGANQPAFRITNAPGNLGVLMHKVSIINAVIGWDISSTEGETVVFLEYCDVSPTGGPGSYGLKALTAPTGESTYVNLENFYIYTIGENQSAYHGLDFSGPGTIVNLQSFGLEGEGDGTLYGHALHIQDGAIVDAKAGSISGWYYAAHVSNVGAAPTLNFNGVSFYENTLYDLWADHPTGRGSLNGTATRTKVDTTGTPYITLAFADIENNEFVQTGHFYMGQTTESLTDVTSLLLDTPPIGLLDGGVMSSSGGLVLNVTGGSGYLYKNGEVAFTTWETQNITLTANQSPYIYITPAGTIAFNVTEPNGSTNILLGRVGVNASAIYSLGSLSVNIRNHGNQIENFLRQAIGSVYISGSLISENPVTPRAIDLTAGRWMYGTQVKMPSAKTAPVFLDIYRLSGVNTFTPTNIVPNGTIDTDSASLTAMTAGYYTKHGLYISGEGIYQQLSLSHGQAQYASLEEARQAPMPTPRISPDSSPPIAALIMQQGNNSIVEIIDIRPIISGGTSGGGSSSSVTTHGDLSNLDADDHLQYLLADGSRSMTGNLNLGTYNITSVGLLNGVDIEDHESRHTPNGSDPLPTAAAVTLTGSSTNTVGINDSFARSDHTHALSITTSNVAEGSNMYWTTARGTTTARNAHSAGTNISYDSATGVISAPNVAAVTATRIVAARNISFSGDISGGGSYDWSADAIISTALTTTGVTAGTYNRLTVDTKGRITSALTRTITGTANQVSVTNGDGVAANPVVALADNVVVPGTASITVPIGTTAQRAGTPTTGMMRFNSTIGRFEGYSGVDWVPMQTQVARIFNGEVGQTSGATTITLGTTAPTTSNGSQIWSQTIAPLSVNSLFDINFTGVVDASSSARSIIVAVFRNTTFIGYSMAYISTTGGGQSLSIHITDAPATTSNVTYSCRIGASANTWYLGRGASATMGGANSSGWEIKEIV